MTNKIAVIGGGPAGILAAGTAASRGKKVILFEKNDNLGKKLSITGNRRCNVTNACSIEKLIDSVVTNKKFLYSSFYTFSNQDILNLLQTYGVKTKTEDNLRCFPISDDAKDVINAFKRYLKDKKVTIKLSKEVKDIKKVNNKFQLFFNNANKENFNKIILATGGISYPNTGSTGDGYKWAKKFGHTIIKPKPALVPIEIKENWAKELQGLALRKSKIKTFIENKLKFELSGEMLFTHYGISGPIILELSSFINKYSNKNIHFKLDLLPDISEVKLDRYLIKLINNNPSKLFKNILEDILPKRIIPIILNESKISSKKACNQITKSERNNCIYSIKNLKMTYKNLRAIKEAIVTSGGVSTSEINPSTMESKLIPGLYFAGEIIDIDAITGGFNLQIAFSTGYLAGLNC
ncbi:NAD(P)/FAD-dependent oxidoreductase [Thermohalobacter berrensis]|uniref:FAD-dependent oxidoreductase n=1 Tax=Thermohalobacter berrensis TaxID=99594 RepID=A0A419TAM9_9FIRM|nr:NAD(P)/FAD-dependent oxidoreductase [Thermohalobacter berrensis]RKD34525.1 FAD-dependent oxidoreductase [Thermohalobacter berrensis]